MSGDIVRVVTESGDRRLNTIEGNLLELSLYFVSLSDAGSSDYKKIVIPMQNVLYIKFLKE